MKSGPYKSGESGVALLTTLLVLLLMSALMAGFYAAVNSDVRATAIDRDQTQAYAAAHAGLEKLTSDLATLFATDVSPSKSEILAMADNEPDIAGFEFRSPGDVVGSGYKVAFNKVDGGGNPAPEDPLGSYITTGPYKGLKGIVTKYPITITARSKTGHAEVRLRRELQTVAVPVFQFGIFSDTDLSIFAGGDFSFGGRVHTNGSLFVCHQTNSGTMTFNDRITAVKEVVHNYWSNTLSNASTSPSCTNNVLIPTSASTNRNLKQSPNEGSVSGMPGSTPNPNWKTISDTTYKSYIRTGATGAKKLDLPLVSQGAAPIDLIRRPARNSNENTANAVVYLQRYFAQASLRILLSDRISDIRDLPTVTATDPVLLTGDWAGAGFPVGYGTGGLGVDGTHPPIARSPGTLTALSTKSSSCCGTSGYIKTNNAISGDFAIPSGLGGLVIGANLGVTCTGKTDTAFTGCNLGVNVANNAVVLATTSWGLVQTTVNGAVSSGSSRTVTINTPTVGGGVSGFRTAPFSINTFFIEGELYTCTGYDTTPQFTDCNTSPTPSSNKAITSAAVVDRNTATIGGYIKIEKQNAAGVWSDVTLEILNLGIGAKNQQGAICADPTPDAVLRIQRLRDNNGDTCPYASSRNSWDWWPNTLYDPREGSLRDTSTSMTMGGIMQYVSLDVGNLKKWFAGTTGTTGTTALNANNNGFIVYFSDRRGNHDAGNGDAETGEYGFEDQVNSTTSAGTPDDQLQAGEDMNGNLTGQRYGKIPSNIAENILGNPVAPYDSTLSNGAGTTGSSPWRAMTAANAGQARVNKVVLFRRALKIVNGGISGGVNNLPAPGFTVATENPAYVQGNYNATSSDTLAEPNVPAAIIADAITLLSNGWSDYKVFDYPTSATNRNASETGWRFGAVAGKGLSFAHCGSTCGDPGDLFGTDGGAANFLRLLEDWNGAGGLNYRGSLITLHISRQAVGTYKFPAPHVYNGGERNFAFDIEFLTPTLLPPGTPMFRDVNTLTFRQILRPTQ